MYDTPHSVQFQNLTKQLLLICSDCGAISGMTAQSIDHYSRLALFHDVGKQAIPPAILDKPGPLTPEEFAVMKTHTVEGCRLLAEDPTLSAREDFSLICDVCRHHHERWDGGGYPDGLSGCRIAPWVQAVGLADAFDALLHPRPYKPAYLWTQAASMIMDGACGAFDPDILLCFRWGVGRIYAAVYENTLY